MLFRITEHVPSWAVGLTGALIVLTSTHFHDSDPVALAWT